MPLLRSDQIKVFNPATGTRQRLEVFTIPQLLPEIEQILEVSGGSPQIQSATRANYQVRVARNWQIGAQLTLGSIVHSVGIPTMALFEDVMDAVGVDAQKIFNDAIKQAGKTLQETISSLAGDGEQAVGGAIKAGLAEGVGHAVDNVSVIPIIGWIVQIGVGLIKLITKFVKIHRRDQFYGVELDPRWPTKFSAEGDTIIFQNYFDRVREFQDWTRIYMPPTLGKVESWHDVVLEHFLEPGCSADTSKKGKGFNAKWHSCTGVRFIGSNPIDGALGNVPGAGWLHSSIEYFKNNIRIEPGEFLPSTRSQAGWLWQNAIKGNTPTAFTIDTDQLQAMWESYLMDMRIAISQSRLLSDTDRRNILTFWNGGPDDRGKYREIFGWFTGTSSPPPSVKPSNNEWDRYAPVRECKALRQKQRKMLDTIAVAYIDERFPAVDKTKSPEFHELWDRRRRQLLEHRDRCLVDLSNVPDLDYRQALRASGVEAGICAQVSGDWASPSLQPSRTTPGLGQDGMPGGGGGDSAPQGTKRTSSGGALLLGAGVAAVGYAAHKGYLRKTF